MRFAMAQPCFGSSEMVFRIKRSRVPWTRSFGFAILWLSTTLIVDCQGVRGEDQKIRPRAMTRAKEFLFGTWAGQRRGPTARAGRARVRLHRQHCHFFVGGPVRSQDGASYLRNR